MRQNRNMNQPHRSRWLNSAENMTTLNYSPGFHAILLASEKTARRETEIATRTIDAEKKHNSNFISKFKDLMPVCGLHIDIKNLVKSIDKDFPNLNKREQMIISAKIEYVLINLSEVTNNHANYLTTSGFWNALKFNFLKKSVLILDNAYSKYESLTYPNKKDPNDPKFIAEIKELYASTSN